MVTRGTKRLEDITAWRAHLKIPDPKSYDWERGAREDTAQWDRENKLSSVIMELLRECISAVGKEPDAMKKTDRMRIIRMLYKRRAFTYQKSVAIVAERLNVSRYTVYKYMHELEEAEAAGSLVQD